jgi:hypothetical protein
MTNVESAAVKLGNLPSTADQHEEILAGLAGERAHSRIFTAFGDSVRWTYNADGSMGDAPIYDLSDAISIEDALDFIRRGFTKTQHVDCFKPEYREHEAKMWDAAGLLIGTFGTVRKAQNYITQQIDLYR